MTSGQAMIEFCMSLLVLLLLVIGLLHVSRMARISLAIHSEIRAEAGVSAMQGGGLGIMPEAISDWNAGPDNIRYTADDKAKINSTAAFGIMGMLVDTSVQAADDWQAVSGKTRLPTSMAALQNVMGMSTFIGFAHESEKVRMKVDPFLQQTVYDAPEITIKEEVWIPQMGGLF